MSLLNKIVNSSLAENKMNKKIADMSYSAINRERQKAKKIQSKEDIMLDQIGKKKPSDANTKKMSLLEKIVNSSLAENKTNRILADMSYSAINGQRQEVKNNQPEGVVMLGQMNREKPLEAITKEMIEDFHQKEQELINAPNMVDGIPMKYKSMDYELLLKKPKDTQNLINYTQQLIGERAKISNDMKILNSEIKKTDETIKKLNYEINEYGEHPFYIIDLKKEVAKMKKLEEELKLKSFMYDKIENTMKINELDKKELDRENAITAQYNKSLLMKYEQDLKQINRNRFNLQQEPNESEAQYYQRLREIQKEKYDPILYKQRAINQNTIELKEKLGDLYSDTSFIQNILKNFNENERFLLNKSFDTIGRQYLNQFGYNNNRLNSKMVAEELKKSLNSIISNASSTLQARIKRNIQGNIYRDNLNLIRDDERLIRERNIRERQLLGETLSQGQQQQLQQQEMRANAALAAERRLEESQRQRRQQRNIRERQLLGETLSQGQQQRQQQQQQQAFDEYRKFARQEQQRERRIKERELLGETLSHGQQQLQQQQQGEAAANIQRVMKGHTGRQKYQQRARAEQQEIMEAENIASQLREAATQQRQQKAQNESATNIQRVMRGHFGRQQQKQEQSKQLYENTLSRYSSPSSLLQSSQLRRPRSEPLPINAEVQRNIENLQKFERIASMYQPQSSLRRPSVAEQTARNELDRMIANAINQVEEKASLSAQSTVPQGQLLASRRLDVGVPRGTYEPTAREQLIKQAREERKAERKSLKEAKKQEEEMRKAMEEGGPAKRGPGRPKKGSGIILKRKPKKESNETKMKNRLRLVASQIEAGNTNPKLIVEVNNLYKKLYNIDNAIMFLTKKKVI